MMKTKAKPMKLTCPKLHKGMAEPDSNPESVIPKGGLSITSKLQTALKTTQTLRVLKTNWEPFAFFSRRGTSYRNK